MMAATIDDKPSAERVLSSARRGYASVPVLGYASLDPEQEEHLKMQFQRQAKRIESECERRGLWLLEVVRERKPQRGPALRRPGLGYALERISAGEAKGLVVAELPRLTHSLPELGRALEWFLHADVRFIVAAPGLDTEEKAGRLAADAIIEISRLEHERLATRTRKGMLAARRKGPRRVADDPELQERIVRMRVSGMTLQAIADGLNAERVPTVRGGARWRPSSVQAAAGYQRPSLSYSRSAQSAQSPEITSSAPSA